MFWPIATEADGRIDITGMTIMEDVDECEVAIGVGAGAIVVVGIGWKTAGLLNETRYIVLPMEIFGVFRGRNIDAKSKSICTTIDFI